MHEAASLHRVPPDRIAVTGSPFFDKWFKKEPLTPEKRATFLTKIGLDPERPYITYLGSSRNIAKDESWLTKEIIETIQKNPQLKDLQVIVRAHPSNARNFERLQYPGVSVWPRVPFPFEFGVPESEESLNDFFASLMGSQAIVGINTSAMIEALICDKPVVSFLHEKYKDTQKNAMHYKQLMNEEVLYLVESQSEFADTLVQLRAGEDERRKFRRRFIANYIRPLGARYEAGQIQAKAILLASQCQEPQLVPKKVRQYVRMENLFNPQPVKT